MHLSSGVVVLCVQVVARSQAMQSSALKSAVNLEIPGSALPKRARLAKSAPAGGAECRGRPRERPTPSRNTWYPVTWAAVCNQALALSHAMGVAPPTWTRAAVAEDDMLDEAAEETDDLIRSLFNTESGNLHTLMEVCIRVLLVCLAHPIAVLRYRLVRCHPFEVGPFKCSISSC